jgi:hypothetical protein
MKKILLSLLLILSCALSYGQTTTNRGGGGGGGTGPAYDSNGNYIGTLTPTNVAGFSGFVPPTQDYPGIMAALKAAIASPASKNILFEDATYALGSNYVPIVGGIGYIGQYQRLAYLPPHDNASDRVVGGTIFTGSAANFFWDGATAQAGITATLASQTSTTTSGSANIAVPNSSLFTVGGRVYVTSNAGGFYTGIAYYVLSATGNVVTLALPDMVAIPATSSTTITIAAGFPNDGTSGVTLANFACNSSNTCIKTGAQNIPGLLYSSMHDIYVHGTPTYRTLDNSNWNACQFFRIYTNDGDGQYWGSNSPGNAYQWGNSFFSQIVNANNGATSTSISQHGILFQAETGSIINELHLNGIQNNNDYHSTVTQTTGALTNTSPNIPVTDSTKFPVGMPLWITSGVNGFTTNVVYWVVSSAANVITISNTKGGTAINSTGTSTMTVNTQGFPGVEIGGITTGIVEDSDGQQFDVEGNSTALMSLLHANITLTAIDQMNVTDAHYTVTGRNFTGKLDSFNVAQTTDFDNSSNAFFNGLKSASANSWPGAGIGYDTTIGSGAYYLNLTPNSPPGFPSCYGVNISNGGFIRCGNPVVDAIRTSDTTKTYAGVSDGGITVFNGAASQTFTLPIITNTSSSSTFVGMRYTIVNASANTLTVATQSSQLFNNQAAQTSMSLTAGQYATYVGGITAGGTLFWIVLTNGSI